MIDWGRGGVVAALREHLYRELGLPAPPRRTEDEAISVETVREAFRNLGEPAELARSALGRGQGVVRADSVRQILTAAVEGAFGEAPGEALTRAVLERGYLKRGTLSHEAVAEALNLSRAGYFRRLRRGCEQVAKYLSVPAA